jgi:hypothetical protein
MSECTFSLIYSVFKKEESYRRENHRVLRLPNLSCKIHYRITVRRLKPVVYISI